MRKLTDKVQYVLILLLLCVLEADGSSAEASELTLEDRITERLKSYRRQLNKMAEEREKEVVL